MDERVIPARTYTTEELEELRRMAIVFATYHDRLMDEWLTKLLPKPDDSE